MSENDFSLGITSLILGDTIMKYLGVKCHDACNSLKIVQKKR